MNCTLLDGAIKYKAGNKKSLLHKKTKFSIKGFLPKVWNYKTIYFFRYMQVNNLIILKIRNVKFSMYFFHMNPNIQ